MLLPGRSDGVGIGIIAINNEIDDMQEVEQTHYIAGPSRPRPSGGDYSPGEDDHFQEVNHDNYYTNIPVGNHTLPMD